MKLSLSGILRRDQAHSNNEWPQKIEFAAREIKRDSLGEPYAATASRELSGFIVLEKEQYEKLRQMDEVLQASMYVSQASLNYPFVIFNKEGKPTQKVATLSTAGIQTISAIIDGREFKAEVSIKGNHPTFTGDVAEASLAKSSRPKNTEFSM